MKTDDLIATLAADTLPRATAGRRLSRALPAGFVLSLLAFVLLWGTRPDLEMVLASVVILKTVGPVVLLVLAGALALSMSRPSARIMAPAGALVGLGVIALAVLGLALLRPEGSGLLATLVVPQLWVCLLSIPLLSLPVLGALLWALSAGAALRPGLTGAMAGAAAGGAGAALYSLYCDQDGALFVLPAYGAAILVVSLIGVVIGRRALRW
jgi:hypothetical protein